MQFILEFFENKCTKKNGVQMTDKSPEEGIGIC